MDTKSSSGWRQVICFVAGATCAALLAALLMVFTAPRANNPNCEREHGLEAKSPHFAKQPEWKGIERLNIEEHAVTVLRTDDANRCYITPYNPSAERRAYALVADPLSDDAIEALAGHDARLFCEDSETYLLRDVNAGEQNRAKRQAEERASGLNLEYEERTPRCMDLVLDCGAGAGEVQTCYTWVNGVILMAQQCESETSFKIYMSKPPGRILKTFQQQWKVCLARRKENKRC